MTTQQSHQRQGVPHNWGLPALGVVVAAVLVELVVASLVDVVSPGVTVVVVGVVVVPVVVVAGKPVVVVHIPKSDVIFQCAV